MIMKRYIISLLLLFTILYTIPSTLNPIYADDLNQQVPLSQQYAFGNIKSLSQGVGYIIGPAFEIAGILVLFYFLIGAFQYLTSGGDKNTTASAQGKITHAIIGFVLLILLFVIMKFVPEVLGLSGFNIIQ